MIWVYNGMHEGGYLVSVKKLIKDFLRSDAFREYRRIAMIRQERAISLKELLRRFSRSNATATNAFDAIGAAVVERADVDGVQVPVWGFGDEGTVKFLGALQATVPVRVLSDEFRRGIVGAVVENPGDRLNGFLAFVGRIATQGEPNPHLHVGYAMCFLSFCWHVLYERRVPVFYGSSHVSLKTLIKAGILDGHGYDDKDLGARYVAFNKACSGLLDLFQKVNARLDYWCVEAFLNWYLDNDGQQYAAGVSSSVVSVESARGSLDLETIADRRSDPHELTDADVSAASASTSAPERRVVGAFEDVVFMGTLAEISDRLDIPMAKLDDATWVLRKRRRLLISGALGVGKSYLARELGRYTADSTERLMVVALHEACTRDQLIEAPAQGYLKAKPGLLTAFAQAAAAEPSQSWVLVLENLRMAQTETLLAEWLLLLSQRAGEVELPYSRRPFSLPKNLSVIGTADDALALSLGPCVLAETFPWVRLSASSMVLKRFLTEQAPEHLYLADMLRQVNAMLAQDVHSNFEIGHGLFMVEGLTKQGVRAIWTHEVMPRVRQVVTNPSLWKSYAFDTMLEGGDR